jgi:hypothetical protein
MLGDFAARKKALPRGAHNDFPRAGLVRYQAGDAGVLPNRQPGTRGAPGLHDFCSVARFGGDPLEHLAG